MVPLRRPHRTQTRPCIKNVAPTWRRPRLFHVLSLAAARRRRGRLRLFPRSQPGGWLLVYVVPLEQSAKTDAYLAAPRAGRARKRVPTRQRAAVLHSNPRGCPAPTWRLLRRFPRSQPGRRLLCPCGAAGASSRADAAAVVVLAPTWRRPADYHRHRHPQ